MKQNTFHTLNLCLRTNVKYIMRKNMRKNGDKMKKQKFTGIVIGITCVLLFCGCRQSEPLTDIPELKDPVGFEDDTVKVERRDVYNESIYVGEIVPEVLEMSFGTSGIIDKCNIKVGSKVKKGQVLATLEGTSDKQAIREKEEEINAAGRSHKDANNVSLAEIKSLKDSKKQLRKSYQAEKNKANKKRIRNQIIDQTHNIKMAETKLRQNKELQALEIEKLRKERGYLDDNTGSSSLVAPISAEVLTINQTSGATVEEGDTVVCLAVMSKPRIRTEFVSSGELESSSSYTAVVLGKEYKAEADYVDLNTEQYGYGYDETSTPTYSYYDFTEKKVSCKVGDFAVIHLQKNFSPNTLSVPANAVWHDEENQYIYVEENGAKVRRIVTTGVRSPAYAEILSGAEEGELVYVES